jgi:hypothetical protein
MPERKFPTAAYARAFWIAIGILNLLMYAFVAVAFLIKFGGVF